MSNAPRTGTPLFRRLAALPRPAWVICAGMFINKFGNFYNVFLVLYLTHQGHSPFLAGLALGAVGLGSFFGNTIGGTVADRIGRRWTIVVSMFGTAVLTLLVPVVSDIYLTIALAVAIGFFGQLYRPAGGAILVDTVPEPLRVTAFAVLRLAINVGMSVGPLVGGLLSTYSYTYLFIGNAIACFLFGLIVALLLPETRPGPAAGGPPPPDRGYREVFADRALVLYLFAMFAATYVYVQATATLPLHVRDIGLSNTFYGLLLGVNALICVLVELPLVRHTEHRNPRHVMALGLVLLAIGMGLTGAADGRASLLATVLIWTVAEMIYTPVATAYPGMLAPDHLRARYQGAEGIAVTLAQTAGPALGGLVYATSKGAHWVSAGMVGLLGALLVFGARSDQAKPTGEPVGPVAGDKPGSDPAALGGPDAGLEPTAGAEHGHQSGHHPTHGA